MLKMLAKKGKSNKGFTLIELIVVIAIIAILALLLVPRFAGFTEDARVSNDRNACETIERAFMTLLANNTYARPTATVTMTITRTAGANDVWAYVGANQLTNVPVPPAAAVAFADTAVEAGIEALTGDIEIQATSRHNVFTITIDTTGAVTCVVS